MNIIIQYLACVKNFLLNMTIDNLRWKYNDFSRLGSTWAAIFALCKNKNVYFSVYF